MAPHSPRRPFRVMVSVNIRAKAVLVLEQKGRGLCHLTPCESHRTSKCMHTVHWYDRTDMDSRESLRSYTMLADLPKAKESVPLPNL